MTVHACMFVFVCSLVHVYIGANLCVCGSLQKQNRELLAKVAELQSALDAERRCVSALEVRLRNAECSRDGTQKRNQVAPTGPP